MVGAIVGLVQFRIKRLLAYSTISHVGFLLLALTVQSTESIQAFIFYLMQYSLSNINIFFITILIGYSLAYYVNKKYDMKEETEMENSPIQLIIQLKGYFQLNPILALSLAITLFSFMGIPPLIGFFAKQAVLSAALQGGFYFLTLVGILTSVISAVYYLGIVKSMFFEDSESKEIKLSSDKEGFNIQPPRYPSNSSKSENTAYLVLSSPLSFIVSVLTLIILLFIFYPQV
jgi:NADH-ubiquinone oxidoreductase chain 2